MSEDRIRDAEQPVDSPSMLMRAIKQISAVMELTESESLHSDASDLRTDLMVIAELAEYAARPAAEVKKDFHETGDARIQQLIERADGMGEHGAVSMLAGMKSDLREAGVLPQRSFTQMVEASRNWNSQQGIAPAGAAGNPSGNGFADKYLNRSSSPGQER